jgi:hypothetical protein
MGKLVARNLALAMTLDQSERAALDCNLASLPSTPCRR